jgi:hypothetical protein
VGRGRARTAALVTAPRAAVHRPLPPSAPPRALTALHAHARHVARRHAADAGLAQRAQHVGRPPRPHDRLCRQKQGVIGRWAARRCALPAGLPACAVLDTIRLRRRPLPAALPRAAPSSHPPGPHLDPEEVAGGEGGEVALDGLQLLIGGRLGRAVGAWRQAGTGGGGASSEGTAPPPLPARASRRPGLPGRGAPRRARPVFPAGTSPKPCRPLRSPPRATRRLLRTGRDARRGAAVAARAAALLRGGGGGGRGGCKGGRRGRRRGAARRTRSRHVGGRDGRASVAKRPIGSPNPPGTRSPARGGARGQHAICREGCLAPTVQRPGSGCFGAARVRRAAENGGRGAGRGASHVSSTRVGPAGAYVGGAGVGVLLGASQVLRHGPEAHLAARSASPTCLRAPSPRGRCQGRRTLESIPGTPAASGKGAAPDRSGPTAHAARAAGAPRLARTHERAPAPPAAGPPARQAAAATTQSGARGARSCPGAGRGGALVAQQGAAAAPWRPRGSGC